MINRYVFTLPLIFCIPFTCGILYYFLFKFKRIRKTVRFTIPFGYALLNAYLIIKDSFDGVVQWLRNGQMKSDDPIWAVLGAGVGIAVLAIMLCAFGYILAAPGMNYALWKRIGQPKGVGFWDFVARMSEIYDRREKEREAQREEDLKKYFGEENIDVE